MLVDGAAVPAPDASRASDEHDAALLITTESTLHTEPTPGTQSVDNESTRVEVLKQKQNDLEFLECMLSQYKLMSGPVRGRYACFRHCERQFKCSSCFCVVSLFEPY